MNIFQIFSPLICLFLIWLVRYEIRVLFEEDYSFQNIHTMPFFLNLPTSFYSQSTAYPISSSDCLKWFLVQDQRLKSPDNLPLNKLFHPNFAENCRKANNTVPFFRETDQETNKDIFADLIDIDRFPFTIGEEMQSLDKLPDAAVTVKKFQKGSLDLTVQVNDLLFNEYHRDNGFSKISFKIPKKGFNFFKALDSGKKSNSAQESEEKSYDLSDIFSKTDDLASSDIKERSKRIFNRTSNAVKNIFKRQNSSFPVI